MKDSLRSNVAMDPARVRNKLLGSEPRAAPTRRFIEVPGYHLSLTISRRKPEGLVQRFPKKGQGASGPRDHGRAQRFKKLLVRVVIIYGSVLTPVFAFAPASCSSSSQYKTLRRPAFL